MQSDDFATGPHAGPHAECRKIRAKIFLWRYPTHRVALSTTFSQEQLLAELHLRIGRWAKLRYITQQSWISELRQNELRDVVQILVGPLISSHAGVLEISPRVAQPRQQPIRPYFASDLGQFR